jgi:hypothetical protein
MSFILAGFYFRTRFTHAHVLRCFAERVSSHRRQVRKDRGLILFVCSPYHPIGCRLYIYNYFLIIIAYSI